MAAQQDLFGFVPPSPSKAKPPPPKAMVAVLPARPRLTLIDATGFVFRAYHALPSLTSSKGVVTHAVLGFTRMVLKLLRERAPTHVALCFDKDSRKGRLAIDPTYKANREAPPDDLLHQLHLIRNVATVLNLPQLEFSGWEADDVIATLTAAASRQGLDVEIIASDKDFLQLLSSSVRVFDPVKDRELDAAYAKERYGVGPEQMRDFQALVGDAIDNVAKVPGVGPKTAVDLLTQFGSVPQLLVRLAEVSKPKLRAALENNRAQLERAYQLVGFRDDLPIPFDLQALERKPIALAEARALFTEFEFFRLLSDLPQGVPTPVRHEATLVSTSAELSAVVQVLSSATTVGLSCVLQGAAHSSAVVALGLAVDGGVWCLDVAALGDSLTSLAVALSRQGLTVAAYDGKLLFHALASVDLKIRVDTHIELMSYLLNPSRKEHALADLARERLHAELPLRPELGAPVAAWAAALGAEADATLRLAPPLWQELDGVGLHEVAVGLEMPLVAVLAAMERAGIAVDLAVLADIATHVDAQCGALLAEVYRHAGHELNVGSPAQLAQVLFDELNLPVLKKGKTGPSTDHEVLEKLAEQHPLPQAIIDYRNVAKLKSTYLDTLPALVGPDGRVRTTFQQAVAATGRLSSVNPNLQNIPVRSELGRQLRRAFVAPPGFALVSADYSQIELRILAHMARDTALVDAFVADADVHARTAAEVFGVPEAEVTAAQRRAAKMVNYGIAYGLSPHGLAVRLNIPVDEARGIIDNYFRRFPGISGYVEGTLEKAKKRGYVESLFGRRRFMPDLASKNRNIMMAAERAAINMPIQGTAADLVKRAMLALAMQLPTVSARARLLLQVHDELVLEAPVEEASAVASLAQRVMMAAGELVVPLKVDVGVGPSWAQAH